MIMRKNLVLIIFSLVFTFLILFPIHQSGVWYPMHDSTHVARVLLMKITILGGQIPPIWAGSINGGLGYPLFHFYAPLFHTIATALSFPFSPITSALKLTLFLSIFTGIFGSMYFVKRWGRLAAVVSGAAFALAPYTAVNLYVRGAFSEYLSLALLPWVLVVTEKISSWRKMVAAGVFLSLFVLSHNLIPLVALPMVLVWMIYQNRSRLKLVAGAIILSLALSAWFVLPLMLERGFTAADDVARTTSYAQHFVEPWQLWNSTWGFGGSSVGVEDGMSFKLGKIQIILGIVGIIYALWQKKKSLIILAFFLLISVFLTIPASKFVWDRLSVLQIVQFPWRNLGLITVFLSLFSGFAISRARNRVLRFTLACLVIALLFWTNYKYFAPQSTFESSDSISDIASVIPEYAPIWLSHANPYVEGSTILPYAYYPTWEVRIDGKAVQSYPSVEGELAFYNPEHSSNFTFHQGHTGLEKFAAIISLVSLFVMIKLYVKN